jgi:hypothetical protein
MALATTRKPRRSQLMTRDKKNPSAELHAVLAEADELIRRRLKEIHLEAPHLLVAVTPDGQVILRSNVSPNVLRAFGDDLKNAADELTAPPQPGDMMH